MLCDRRKVMAAVAAIRLFSFHIIRSDKWRCKVEDAKI